MNAPLIIGYDGRAESEDVLALTRVLAGALEAPVIVVSVLPMAPLEIEWVAYSNEVQDRALRLQDDARRALAGLANVETVVVSSASPARELDQLARDRNAALVVLGSTHRGRFGHVWPGAVADRMLSGGPCPVAVAPRGFARRDRQLQTIGVGFDGSPESRLALAQAGEIARSCAATLNVAAVFDARDPVAVADAALGYAGLVAPPAPSREQIDRVWSETRMAIEDLSGLVSVLPEVVEGEPGAVLSELSARVDLLVVGSRGYGPLGRVLLGSVSSHLLKSSCCPLIVTPRPAAPPQQRHDQVEIRRSEESASGSAEPGESPGGKDEPVPSQ